ncbi:hypothetical protein I79_024494 [Cricetulus griseus]|uniref:Uncharacterized protein n=1 Tax=Cricetulus griseus TaxID=10029 RepID=G3IKU1_CRIGR|nr:hypothetical protein I79_024494 [Cricetulus griseus]
MQNFQTKVTSSPNFRGIQISTRKFSFKIFPFFKYQELIRNVFKLLIRPAWLSLTLACQLPSCNLFHPRTSAVSLIVTLTRQKPPGFFLCCVLYM